MPFNSLQEKSYHQQQVEAFMLRAKQEVPLVPTEPTPEVRVLRAKLILEEALETIEALGVSAYLIGYKRRRRDGAVSLVDATIDFEADGQFNMEETIDGCCDIKVVTTGCLSACGIPDVVFQEEVDNNNLAKFKPGHYWREDGKLMKPPGHAGPRVRGILRTLAVTLGLKEDENPYLYSQNATHAQAAQANGPVHSVIHPASPG